MSTNIGSINTNPKTPYVSQANSNSNNDNATASNSSFQRQLQSIQQGQQILEELEAEIQTLSQGFISPSSWGIGLGGQNPFSDPSIQSPTDVGQSLGSGPLVSSVDSNLVGTADSTGLDSIIQQASSIYGVPANLIHGVIQQESGMNPSAVSSAGALGLMQLMPSTASTLGVSNPLDPTQNVMGGTKYLASLLQQFGGNQELALAAYNAGPGAVQQYGGIPPYAETQNYVQKVMDFASQYA